MYTKRESEVLDLLLDACTNKEIADRLRLAEHTVKMHFNRLFLKNGISSGDRRVKLAVKIWRERHGATGAQRA